MSKNIDGKIVKTFIRYIRKKSFKEKMLRITKNDNQNINGVRVFLETREILLF